MFWLALLLFACVLSAQAPNTAVLHVTVVNVPSAKGNVRLGLWNRKDGWPDVSSAFRKDVGAISGQRIAVFRFLDLAPGEYAVAAMHDENLNAKLDKNFFGYPKEAVAFSGGARINMGAPSFESARFSIHSGEQEIKLDFQTFKKW